MAFKISKSSWHFRLYSYYRSSLVGSPFFNSQICLCPYMRALLIWLPLRFFFQRVVPVALVLSILALNIRDYGFLHVLEFIAAVLGVAAVVGGLIFAGAVFVDWLKERRSQRPQKVHSEPTTLVGQWIKSNHEKICPCFEIVE